MATRIQNTLPTIRLKGLTLLCLWLVIGESYQGAIPNTNEWECAPDDTIIPDPQDCRKFYNCVHGRLKSETCPVNTHFNPDYLVCDWPDNVRCAQGTVRVPEDPLSLSSNYHHSDKNPGKSQYSSGTYSKHQDAGSNLGNSLTSNGNGRYAPQNSYSGWNKQGGQHDAGNAPSLSYPGSTGPSGPSVSYGANVGPIGPHVSYGLLTGPRGPSVNYGKTVGPVGPSVSYDGGRSESSTPGSYGNERRPYGPSTSYGSNEGPSGPSASYGSNEGPSGPSASYGSNEGPSGPSASYGSNEGLSGPSASYGSNEGPSGPSRSYSGSSGPDYNAPRYTGGFESFGSSSLDREHEGSKRGPSFKGGTSKLAFYPGNAGSVDYPDNAESGGQSQNYPGQATSPGGYFRNSIVPGNEIAGSNPSYGRRDYGLKSGISTPTYPGYGGHGGRYDSSPDNFYRGQNQFCNDVSHQHFIPTTQTPKELGTTIDKTTGSTTTPWLSTGPDLSTLTTISDGNSSASTIQSPNSTPSTLLPDSSTPSKENSESSGSSNTQKRDESEVNKEGGNKKKKCICRDEDE